MTYDTEKAEALMEKLASENVAKIRANKMCAEGKMVGRTWKPYIVKFSHMVAEMKSAGLKYPADYITLANWMKPIADKVLPKYQRQLKRTK
jgi:hypothetical protein